MADEARVKLKVDATDAKKDVDAVNGKLDKTEKKGAKFAKQARAILTRSVAAAAAVGAVVDQAAGGGFLSSLSSTAGALIGAGARRAGLGGDTLREGIAQNRALDQAIADTKKLVEAGGSITDEEIKGLITQFKDLRTPGARNVQRVEVAGQEQRAAGAIENAAESWKEAANEFRQAISAFKLLTGR